MLSFASCSNASASIDILDDLCKGPNIKVKCRKTFILIEITFTLTGFIIYEVRKHSRERLKPKHAHFGKCHANKAKIIIITVA